MCFQMFFVHKPFPTIYIFKQFTLFLLSPFKRAKEGFYCTLNVRQNFKISCQCHICNSCYAIHAQADCCSLLTFLALFIFFPLLLRCFLSSRLFCVHYSIFFKDLLPQEQFQNPTLVVALMLLTFHMFTLLPP
jgi:hypothetical protein